MEDIFSRLLAGINVEIAIITLLICVIIYLITAKSALPPPYDGFVGLIGNTPLVELKMLSKATGCTILGKAEFLNPGGEGSRWRTIFHLSSGSNTSPCPTGSLKDRVAKQIVLEAESDGRLLPGGTIYEGTAGSTGIALASVAKARGYGCR